MEPLSEPTFWLVNVFTWGFPTVGYFAGMGLCHCAFKSDNGPNLLQRMAVGIPAGLMLVSSFNALLSEIGTPSFASVIFVTGFLMEQGLLIEFGLSHFIKRQGQNR